MLALYRPGPLESGMVDDYIQVKHGARVRYPHEILEEILKANKWSIHLSRTGNEICSNYGGIFFG